MSMLVLVADDDEAIRELYTIVFPHMAPHMRIATVSGGAEAVVHARTSKPDVILMDLNMPGLDGIEATRRLKADPATARIPVIAITGGTQLDGRAQAAGCVGHVQKPSTAAEILREIERVLGSN
jgi:two-component system, cell cycle response regulator DivK